MREKWEEDFFYILNEDISHHAYWEWWHFRCSVTSWAAAENSDVNLIWMMTNCFAKGRTGKESLAQASLYHMYFVTLWIRQSFIGPPFPTVLIFRDGGGTARLVPLLLRHCTSVPHRRPLQRHCLPARFNFLQGYSDFQTSISRHLKNVLYKIREILIPHFPTIYL